jgi:ribosomal protein S18 acetylase RimI-like enzyme
MSHAIPSMIRLDAALVDRASGTFARAFQHDPLFGYLIPDDSRRPQLSTRAFTALLRFGLHGGETYATSCNVEAAAIWFPPDTHPSFLALVRSAGLVATLSLGPGMLLRFWKYQQHSDRLRRQHAPFRHWWLQLLGVDPNHQGKGLATALLEPMLQRFDRDKMPCCLETMNEKNVSLYERFGFRVVARGELPRTDVRIWLMARGA